MPAVHASTRDGLIAGIGVCACAAAVFAVFSPTLAALVRVWSTQQEYSFGYLIPFVALFLLYQRLDVLAATPWRDAWSGVALVALGLALGILGRIGTLDTVAQYGFLCVTWGLALSCLGWRTAGAVALPLGVLAFMVPIPNYVLRELSQALQLISSQLGVQLIRWCNVSVYLEGNVIDLGTMRLQVVEACSGLRYLFSLLVMSFLVACFYRAAIWKRALVCLSAVPITVVMNSVRIAIVGVTVDRWGPSVAEGLLHDFEGLTVFMGCIAILIAEVWLLCRLDPAKPRLRDVLAIDIPTSNWRQVDKLIRRPGRAGLTAMALVAVTAVTGFLLPDRVHAIPERPVFATFPLQLGQWSGMPERLPADVLEILKLDDYLLADFRDPAGAVVNLYASWYATQSDGNSVHSPRACLPGDGWEIHRFDTTLLSSVAINGIAPAVNRVVIQKGENRALVYYWFQQRGRFITGEYPVKLHILADSLTRHRTDGAMVRLVTPLDRGEDLARAESRLQAFAAAAMPQLRRFIPE